MVHITPVRAGVAWWNQCPSNRRNDPQIAKRVTVTVDRKERSLTCCSPRYWSGTYKWVLIYIPVKALIPPPYLIYSYLPLFQHVHVLQFLETTRSNRCQNQNSSQPNVAAISNKLLPRGCASGARGCSVWPYTRLQIRRLSYKG